ncbi:phosphoglycerate kinase [Marinicella gelatinilytica]|uniref:phosphoglycerate kinase n=1 Tax=Marinicella gelatinilytica TaxID=2996017 RepID=UPI002260F2A9|nr:phosphoglycerate kinase [Marinicella gelatinilytica]MCX7545651.1 phosphoglycerate kinase [Marinicella gelatinilytica]
MMKHMSDIDLTNKRVLIREDLNVPMDKGTISNETRLLAAVPTIKQALSQQAAVILVSHLGRPTAGKYESKYSLLPVANRLGQLLNQDVQLIKDWHQGVDVQPGEMVLLENIRFEAGEKSNDDELAKKLAALCDVFVMDAFGTSHRAHASTYGVAQFAPMACAGPLLIQELDALQKGLKNPEKPMLAIIGGSKVSGKLQVLHSLVNQVDKLIVGGGIANTFIKAAGFRVGQSLHEPDLVEEAKQLIDKAKQAGNEIPIPEDVVVATEFSADALAEVKAVDEVADNEMILDIGPKTAAFYAYIAKQAKTVVWNGPVGVFEFPQFSKGTQLLAEGIAEGGGFSMAGGGDTLAALAQFGIEDNISYISTGGGAFLQVLEGKPLPAVTILEQVADR